MSNLYQHERRDKIKWVVTFVLLLGIIGSIVLGCCTGWYTDWNFGKKAPTDGDGQEPVEEVTHGNAIIGESEGKGIKLMSARIAEEDYEEYGISPQADTAYTLTATIDPYDATIRDVTWSVDFQIGYYPWSVGKTVTDYVTVRQDSNNGLKATVTCLQPFGTPIVVKVATTYDSMIYASCICDYVKRVESSTFKLIKTNGAEATSIEIGTLDKNSISGTGYRISGLEAVTYGVGTVTGVMNSYNILYIYHIENFPLMLAQYGKITRNKDADLTVPITLNSSSSNFYAANSSWYFNGNYFYDIYLPSFVTDSSSVNSTMLTTGLLRTNQSMGETNNYIKIRAAWYYTYQGKSIQTGYTDDQGFTLRYDTTLIGKAVNSVSVDSSNLVF